MQRLDEVLRLREIDKFNGVELYRIDARLGGDVSFLSEVPNEFRLAELNRVLHRIHGVLYGEIIDKLNEAIDIAMVSGEPNSHEQMYRIRKMIAECRGTIEELPEIMKKK